MSVKHHKICVQIKCPCRHTVMQFINWLEKKNKLESLHLCSFGIINANSRGQTLFDVYFSGKKTFSWHFKCFCLFSSKHVIPIMVIHQVDFASLNITRLWHYKQKYDFKNITLDIYQDKTPARIWKLLFFLTQVSFLNSFLSLFILIPKWQTDIQQFYHKILNE